MAIKIILGREGSEISYKIGNIGDGYTELSNHHVATVLHIKVISISTLSSLLKLKITGLYLYSEQRRAHFISSFAMPT